MICHMALQTVAGIDWLHGEGGIFGTVSGSRQRAREGAVNVQRLRKARGMSQDELADAVGIQTAAISHIENRRGNPTLTTLEGIAAALGVRFGGLFRAR